MLVTYLSPAWEWSALMVQLIVVGSVKGVVHIEWGKNSFCGLNCSLTIKCRVIPLKVVELNLLMSQRFLLVKKR